MMTNVMGKPADPALAHQQDDAEGTNAKFARQVMKESKPAERPD
jgi:hypothetical protein